MGWPGWLGPPDPPSPVDKHIPWHGIKGSLQHQQSGLFLVVQDNGDGPIITPNITESGCKSPGVLAPQQRLTPAPPIQAKSPERSGASPRPLRPVYRHPRSNSTGHADALCESGWKIVPPLRAGGMWHVEGPGAMWHVEGPGGVWHVQGPGGVWHVEGPGVCGMSKGLGVCGMSKGSHCTGGRRTSDSNRLGQRRDRTRPATHAHCGRNRMPHATHRCPAPGSALQPRPWCGSCMSIFLTSGLRRKVGPRPSACVRATVQRRLEKSALPLGKGGWGRDVLERLTNVQ